MGLSGLVGARAASGLEDLLTRQLLEAKQAEAVRAQQMEEALRGQQIDVQRRQVDVQRQRLEAEQAHQAAMDEQAGIDALRKGQDRTEARLSRVQGEQDQMDAKSELDTLIAALDPRQQTVVKLGGKLSMKDMQTPEDRQAEEDAAVRKAGRIAKAQRGPGDEKRQWLLRNGAPVYEAPRPGDTPYDRTRTGERPVLSSDANAIADIDNSINLLDGLQEQIGKTGSASFIQANMPNAITDATGIGADAKSRQAMINQAKQIIGKALEGGVLRKEDEAKYDRILPTIGDPPEVASSKIAELKNTLNKKRETTLEALGAAGYGVSRFARPAAAPEPVPSHDGAAERRPIPGIPGGVAELRNGRWVRVQ